MCLHPLDITWDETPPCSICLELLHATALSPSCCPHWCLGFENPYPEANCLSGAPENLNGVETRGFLQVQFALTSTGGKQKQCSMQWSRALCAINFPICSFSLSCELKKHPDTYQGPKEVNSEECHSECNEANSFQPTAKVQVVHGSSQAQPARDGRQRGDEQEAHHVPKESPLLMLGVRVPQPLQAEQTRQVSAQGVCFTPNSKHKPTPLRTEHGARAGHGSRRP